MPIIHYKTKEEVPSDVVDYATEVKDEGEFKGQWSVNLVPRKKLEEFRTNNENISKDKEVSEGLVKKFLALHGVKEVAELDFTKLGDGLAALNDTARKVADGKLKASDDIDKVVEERTGVMRQKFDDELRSAKAETAAAKSERDKSVADFKRTFIDRAVSTSITDPDLGVEPTAMLDIMQRAYGVFVVEEDGTITPKKNGQTMWGDDATQPMTMKEWIGLVLRKEAPHYFKKNTGGGASGGSDTKQFGGMTEAEFMKLSPSRRLEIANKLAFESAKSR